MGQLWLNRFSTGSHTVENFYDKMTQEDRIKALEKRMGIVDEKILVLHQGLLPAKAENPYKFKKGKEEVKDNG